MITNSIFDKYSASTISAMSSNRLLAVFGASQGMPELAEMASSVSTERSISYQCEVMVDDVSIDVTQKTKPGLILPAGSVIRMVKDTPFSEIPDPKTNLRGRLIGVLSTSVRNFDCNPLQPCPECKGDAK